jgi:hypothetical protein
VCCCCSIFVGGVQRLGRFLKQRAEGEKLGLTGNKYPEAGEKNP